jgi:hypothetical protein
VPYEFDGVWTTTCTLGATSDDGGEVAEDFNLMVRQGGSVKASSVRVHTTADSCVAGEQTQLWYVCRGGCDTQTRRGIQELSFSLSKGDAMLVQGGEALTWNVSWKSAKDEAVLLIANIIENE